MNAVSIKGISKKFVTAKGEFEALSSVSFEVEAGNIHGLLGPNGAGKSTLISLITGISKPTSGTIEVFGVDVVKNPVAAKKLIGVVPQEIVIEAAFTVYEVLYYFAGMQGVAVKNRKARIEEVLASLELTDKMNERARSLSGGMKRRLMVAKAILHKPKLLILDEPTAGVDVMLRQRMWDLVRALNKDGTTVLFTTHYLEEAEQLCKNVSVINKGQLVKNGVLKDIQQEFSNNLLTFELFDGAVEHAPGVTQEGIEFHYPVTELAIDLVTIAAHYGNNIKSIKNEAASLESIFLTLTK